MNYTLHQLEVFLQVVDNKSITKAAEALHLTQPAVSIQLKNLQEQFDIPLTEVVNKQLYVTDFGQQIAGTARSILAQVQSIQQLTLAYKGQLAGKIRVSVVSTGKYVMPYFLSEFTQRYPGIELVMDVTNKSRVLDSLANNEVDFSLVSILPERLSVEHTDFLPNKLYCVSAYDLPVGKKPMLEELIQRYPLIYREQGSGTRQTMELFLNSQKLKPQRTMELTSNEAVKQAVQANLGISIMPLIGIRNELNLQQLKIIPIKDLPLQTTWRLVWLKGKQHSPAVRAYLSYLEMHKQTIIERHFDWYRTY